MRRKYFRTIEALSDDMLFMVGDAVVSTEPDPRSQKRGAPRNNSFLPTSLVACPSGEINATFLQSKISQFSSDQDFSALFWHRVVFAFENEERSFTITDDAKKLLNDIQCSEVLLISDARPGSPKSLPEGPYFLHNALLHQTWRLFPDIYEAFQLPTVWCSKTSEFIGITYTHAGRLMVPVPSRLHFPKSPKKPLNGVRITVKDNINLKGVKTTGQSRAYEELYGPAIKTADFVTQLLNLGAIIVGKTKCTQFASSDQPTTDWIDYHCPWNPRGDGYLSPRGSTTGPSVAVAGYDWLDLGLGTDTGGSVRGPAALMGLFALRPSFELSNMAGIIPIARSMDTTGIVCRGTSLFKEISASLYPQPRVFPVAKPVKLIYPLDYWDQWPKDPANEVRETFVSKVEQYLGIKKTKVVLADEWKKAKPNGSNETLAKYLKAPFMNLLWKGYYDSLKIFYQDYLTEFGHPPYLHPTVRYCYDRGAKLTDEEVKDSLQRQHVYASWLRQDIFTPESFDTIMMYPIGDLQPFYRDEYRKPPEDPPTYNWSEREDHQASLAGLPVAIVPIGQTPFPSKVTGKTQLLPTAISVMSSSGTDTQLVSLIDDVLAASALSHEVRTGALAF